MASITVRVDDDTKAGASAILEELGLDLSSATRAFYRQIILRRGLPFHVSIPEGRLTPDMEQRFTAAEARMHDGVDALVDSEEFFRELGI